MHAVLEHYVEVPLFIRQNDIIKTIMKGIRYLMFAVGSTSSLVEVVVAEELDGLYTSNC